MWWRVGAPLLMACLSVPQFGRYFDLEGRKSTFTLELRAGTVTFLTVFCMENGAVSHAAALVVPCAVHLAEQEAAQRCWPALWG